MAAARRTRGHFKQQYFEAARLPAVTDLFRDYDSALCRAATEAQDKHVLKEKVNNAARIACRGFEGKFAWGMARRLTEISEDEMAIQENLLFVLDSIMRHATKDGAKTVRRFEKAFSPVLVPLFKKALRRLESREVVSNYLKTKLIPTWRKNSWFTKELPRVMRVLESKPKPERLEVKRPQHEEEKFVGEETAFDFTEYDEDEPEARDVAPWEPAYDPFAVRSPFSAVSDHGDEMEEKEPAKEDEKVVFSVVPPTVAGDSSSVPSTVPIQTPPAGMVPPSRPPTTESREARKTESVEAVPVPTLSAVSSSVPSTVELQTPQVMMPHSPTSPAATSPVPSSPPPPPVPSSPTKDAPMSESREQVTVELAPPQWQPAWAPTQEAVSSEAVAVALAPGPPQWQPAWAPTQEIIEPPQWQPAWAPTQEAVSSEAVAVALEPPRLRTPTRTPTQDVLEPPRLRTPTRTPKSPTQEALEPPQEALEPPRHRTPTGTPRSPTQEAIEPLRQRTPTRTPTQEASTQPSSPPEMPVPTEVGESEPPTPEEMLPADPIGARAPPTPPRLIPEEVPGMRARTPSVPSSRKEGPPSSPTEVPVPTEAGASDEEDEEEIGPPGRVQPAAAPVRQRPLHAPPSPTEMPVPTDPASPTSVAAMDDEVALAQVQAPLPLPSRSDFEAALQIRQPPAPSSPVEVVRVPTRRPPSSRVPTEAPSSPRTGSAPLPPHRATASAPPRTQEVRSRPPSSPTEMPVPTEAASPTSPAAMDTDLDLIQQMPLPLSLAHGRVSALSTRRPAPSSPVEDVHVPPPFVPPDTRRPSTTMVPTEDDVVVLEPPSTRRHPSTMVPTEAPSSPRTVSAPAPTRSIPPPTQTQSRPPALRTRPTVPSSPTEMPVPTELPSPTSPAPMDTDLDQILQPNLPAVRQLPPEPRVPVPARPVPTEVPTHTEDVIALPVPIPRAGRAPAVVEAVMSSPTSPAMPAPPPAQYGAPTRDVRSRPQPSSPSEMPVPTEAGLSDLEDDELSPAAMPVPTERPSPTSPALGMDTDLDLMLRPGQDRVPSVPVPSAGRARSSTQAPTSPTMPGMPAPLPGQVRTAGVRSRTAPSSPTEMPVPIRAPAGTQEVRSRAVPSPSEMPVPTEMPASSEHEDESPAAMPVPTERASPTSPPFRMDTDLDLMQQPPPPAQVRETRSRTGPTSPSEMPVPARDRQARYRLLPTSSPASDGLPVPTEQPTEQPVSTRRPGEDSPVAMPVPTERPSPTSPGLRMEADVDVIQQPAQDDAPATVPVATHTSDVLTQEELRVPTRSRPSMVATEVYTRSDEARGVPVPVPTDARPPTQVPSAPSSPTMSQVPTGPLPTRTVPPQTETRELKTRSRPTVPSSPTEMPVPTDIPSPTSPAPMDADLDLIQQPVMPPTRQFPPASTAPMEEEDSVLPVPVPPESRARSSKQAPSSPTMPAMPAPLPAQARTREMRSRTAPSSPSEMPVPTELPASPDDQDEESPAAPPVPTERPSPTSPGVRTHTDLDFIQQPLQEARVTAIEHTPTDDAPAVPPLLPVPRDVSTQDDVPGVPPLVPVPSRRQQAQAPSSPTMRPLATQTVPAQTKTRELKSKSTVPSSPTEMPVPTEIPSPTSPAMMDDQPPVPPVRQPPTSSMVAAEESRVPVPMRPVPVEQQTYIEEDSVVPVFVPLEGRPSSSLQAPSSPTMLPMQPPRSRVQDARSRPQEDSSPTEMPVPTELPVSTEDQDEESPAAMAVPTERPSPTSPGLRPVDAESVSSRQSFQEDAPGVPPLMPVPTDSMHPTTQDDAVPPLVPVPIEGRRRSSTQAPSSPTMSQLPPAPLPTRTVPAQTETREIRSKRTVPSSPTEMPVPTEIPSPTSPAVMDADDTDVDDVEQPRMQPPMVPVRRPPASSAAAAEADSPTELPVPSLPRRRPKVPTDTAEQSPTEMPVPSLPRKRPKVPTDRAEQSPTEMPVPSARSRRRTGVPTHSERSPTEMPVPTAMPSPTSPAEDEDDDVEMRPGSSIAPARGAAAPAYPAPVAITPAQMPSSPTELPQLYDPTSPAEDEEAPQEAPPLVAPSKTTTVPTITHDEASVATEPPPTRVPTTVPTPEAPTTSYPLVGEVAEIEVASVPHTVEPASSEVPPTATHSTVPPTLEPPTLEPPSETKSREAAPLEPDTPAVPQVLMLRFPDAPYPPPPKFKTELIRSLRALGAARLSDLALRLREGLLAEVRGPPAVLAALRALPLQNLRVIRYKISEVQGPGTEASLKWFKTQVRAPPPPPPPQVEVEPPQPISHSGQTQSPAEHSSLPTILGPPGTPSEVTRLHTPTQASPAEPLSHSGVTRVPSQSVGFTRPSPAVASPTEVFSREAAGTPTQRVARGFKAPLTPQERYVTPAEGAPGTPTYSPTEFFAEPATPQDGAVARALRRAAGRPPSVEREASSPTYLEEGRELPLPPTPTYSAGSSPTFVEENEPPTPTLEADDEDFADDTSVADWMASATPRVIPATGTPQSDGPSTPASRAAGTPSTAHPSTPTASFAVGARPAGVVRLPGMESPTPTYEPDDETVYGDDASSVASWVASATPRAMDGTSSLPGTPMYGTSSLPGTPMSMGPGTPLGVTSLSGAIGRSGTPQGGPTPGSQPPTPVGYIDAPGFGGPGTPASAASTPQMIDSAASVGTPPGDQPGTPQSGLPGTPQSLQPGTPQGRQPGTPTGASSSAAASGAPAPVPALASEIFPEIAGKRKPPEGAPWQRRAQRRKKQ